MSMRRWAATRALHGDNPRHWIWAIQVLSEEGGRRSVPQLVDLACLIRLKVPDADERIHRALVAIGGRNVQAICGALVETARWDWQEQWRIPERHRMLTPVLGELPEAEDPLLKLCASTDSPLPLRTCAIRALGQLQSVRALPLLLPFALDRGYLGGSRGEADDLRQASVIALGAIGRADTEVLAHLRGALRDPLHSVRAEAALALSSLGYAPIDQAEQAEMAFANGDLAALTACRTAGVSSCLWAATNTDVMGRKLALRALTLIGHASTVAPLVELLQAPSPYAVLIRDALIAIIVRSGPGEIDPDLLERIARLEDVMEEVQEDAGGHMSLVWRSYPLDVSALRAVANARHSTDDGA